MERFALRVAYLKRNVRALEEAADIARLAEAQGDEVDPFVASALLGPEPPAAVQLASELARFFAAAAAPQPPFGIRVPVALPNLPVFVHAAKRSDASVTQAFGEGSAARDLVVRRKFAPPVSLDSVFGEVVEAVADFVGRGLILLGPAVNHAARRALPGVHESMRKMKLRTLGSDYAVTLFSESELATLIARAGTDRTKFTENMFRDLPKYLVDDWQVLPLQPLPHELLLRWPSAEKLRQGLGFASVPFRIVVGVPDPSVPVPLPPAPAPLPPAVAAAASLAAVESSVPRPDADDLSVRDPTRASDRSPSPPPPDEQQKSPEPPQSPAPAAAAAAASAGGRGSESQSSRSPDEKGLKSQIVEMLVKTQLRLEEAFARIEALERENSYLKSNLQSRGWIPKDPLNQQ
eukprot:m51a1_g1821 hypothetical protein (406) ;mRNA; r:500842-502745